MNQAHNGNKFASVIIPRFLKDANKTAFFFAEEEPTGETITAYVEGEGIKEISKEMYHKGTSQLHPEDVKVAVEIYRKQTGVEEVLARARMPYKKDGAMNAPRRLAHVDEEKGTVTIEQELVDKTVDPAVKKVLQNIVDKQAEPEQKKTRSYTKRSDYWAKGAPKKRRAKPIEAQPAVEAQQDETFRQAEKAANKDVHAKSKSVAKTDDPQTIARIVAEVLNQLKAA